MRRKISADGRRRIFSGAGYTQYPFDSKSLLTLTSNVWKRSAMWCHIRLVKESETVMMIWRGRGKLLLVVSMLKKLGFHGVPVSMRSDKSLGYRLE
jgi:hypothetical protein